MHWLEIKILSQNCGRQNVYADIMTNWLVGWLEFNGAFNTM